MPNKYIVTRPVKVTADSDAEALKLAIEGAGEVMNTSISKVSSPVNPQMAAAPPATMPQPPSKK